MFFSHNRPKIMHKPGKSAVTQGLREFSHSSNCIGPYADAIS